MLAASDLRRKESQEASIKYFVLGGMSSAFFLYGIALVYGSTGSTNLVAITEFFANNVLLENGLLLAGLALLLVGLGFKVAAVPFHSWMPDVYQGSPTPVTGFMASVAKAAGFAALLRVFVVAFETYQLDWKPMVWALAVLTMVVGSVLAVVQTDVKRMLAYSSISHAGFVLVGVQAASELGTRSGALLPAGVHVHGAGLVRDRRPGRAAGRLEPRPRAPSRACRVVSRHSRSRSRCSCSPRPACRSRPASSPSST